MATAVLLQHKDSGVLKNGYVGFSWTTACFGVLPALFRGDWSTFLVGLFVAVGAASFTYGIAPMIGYIVWACFYNKFYTRRLMERGYVFAESVEDVPALKNRLGIA